MFRVCFDQFAASQQGRVEEDFEDVRFAPMESVVDVDAVAEVHVVGLEDGGAVEGYCGEGVETREDEVCKLGACGGGFWEKGEVQAVEKGLGGDPLGGEFVGVEEWVGDALGRLVGSAFVFDQVVRLCEEWYAYMLLARRSTWTWLGTLLTGSHSLLSTSFMDHPVRRSIRECSMSMLLVSMEYRALAVEKAQP